MSNSPHAAAPRLRKTDRIAIVGAGPAGIHLAHLLKKRGFARVTLLERETRVGGRTLSLVHRGFPHEMGACYIPDHYHEYRRLVREYGAGILGSPKGHERSIYSSEFDGVLREYEVGKYGESVVAALVRDGTLPPASKIGRLVSLFAALRRYLALRRRLLGTGDYPFARKPSAAAAAELARPFVETVRAHRLQVMLPLFRLVQSAQGYGVLEEIATFYVLLWSTPELVTAFVKNRLGVTRRPLFEMLDAGNQNVFNRVAEADRLDIRLGTAVQRVVRKADAVEIDGEAFDHVVFTIDMPDSLAMLDAPSAFERSAAAALTASSFVTTLFEAEQWPAAAGLAYLMDPLRPNPTSTISGLRDVRYRFPEAGGPGCSAVAYQYADRLLGPAEVRDFAARFDSEMAVLGFRGVRVVQRAVWPYFFRFRKEAVAEGLPWRLFAGQGAHHTWYAGSSACFESLNDVMRYNQLLLATYAEA